MPAQRQSAGHLTGARHELPTHLQVEDHLIAGLTVRQTLLLSAGLSFSYSLWRHLAGVQLGIQATLAPAHVAGLAALLALAIRLALAALPTGAFALIALARPADRPLEEWLVIALRYMTLPKTLIWRSAEANADYLFDSGKDAAGGVRPFEDEDDDEDGEASGEASGKASGKASGDHPMGRFAMIGTVPEQGRVRI